MNQPAENVRLVRIESRLFQIANALGVDLQSRHATHSAPRVMVALETKDGNDAEILQALTLEVTLGELNEACRNLEIDYPVSVRCLGRHVGTFTPHWMPMDEGNSVA